MQIFVSLQWIGIGHTPTAIMPAWVGDTTVIINSIATMEYTLNLQGRLFSLKEPQVMGIVNVTPNSFYAASRVQTAEAICQRVRDIEAEGGTMIDIGACSTNPFLEKRTTEEEEMAALDMALTAIREMGTTLPISIDTYRSRVARRCIEEYQVEIINDVNAGDDADMFPLVAETGTPYIMMPQEKDMASTLKVMARKVQELRDLGQKDIILDPGYGFGKSMEENLRMLNQVDRFQIFELPVLVGISRKRMIYQTLGITANEALNGTTVLNTIALTRGANILRVHDVKECVEAVKLWKAAQ